MHIEKIGKNFTTMQLKLWGFPALTNGGLKNYRAAIIVTLKQIHSLLYQINTTTKDKQGKVQILDYSVSSISKPFEIPRMAPMVLVRL